MWINRLKGSLIALFFVILNLVYLVIELSFNARVLDVSSTLSPNLGFSQLEIYGRTISATGATILCWRLLLPYQSRHNLYRVLLRFLLIAVIVFPVVFIGQKKLVDDLVDLSSPETRRSAEILSLLKYGIAHGFVEIDDLITDELTLQTAEGKMFITLSGLLAYNSSYMRDVLEKKLDTIANYAIATQQAQDTGQLYKHYRYIREQVLVRYAQYQQLVQKLELKQSQSPRQAELIYARAMNDAMGLWTNFQQTLKRDKALDQVSSERVMALSRLLISSQRLAENCSTGRCFDESLKRLEFRLSQLLGVYSPVSEWCREYTDRYQGRALRCDSSSARIQQKMIQARHLTVALQTGLTAAYANKLEFLQSGDFRTAVFGLLRQQGIETSTGWRFSAHQIMLDDITRQLNTDLIKDYDAEVESLLGVIIAPRTGLLEFNQLPSIQALYRQVLVGISGDEIPLNLKRDEFGREYIAPLYSVKLNTMLARLNSQPGWFADDAPYEESGKRSLRNLLVPPVAIAFSLVFGLLNIMTLVLSLVFLLVEESRVLRWLGIFLLGSFILIMPLHQQYTIYSQHAYQDLLSQTEASYGQWVLVLDWLAKTEPQVYPVANLLRYNLLQGFDFN